MYLGVPIMPLTVVSMTVLLFSFWTNILIALLLIPIILVMRAIVKTDDQQFRLLWLKLLCRVIHRNHNATFWKASTYSPLAFHKRK